MNRRGFTLVELVITIVLLGIVAAVGAVFLRAPVDAYLDQVRRANLVDSAEMALRRMAMDVRRAVPNSTRIAENGVDGCIGQCLEMLNTKEGGRYRDEPALGPGGGNPNKRLQFNLADTAFNVQGPFPTGTFSDHHLVIYNLGSGDANAYDVGGSPNVITPRDTTITISNDSGLFANERNVTLDVGHQFRYESPANRIYLVDKAILYQCDDDALWRYDGYEFGTTLTPAFTATAQLVARNVANCDFDYDPGTSTRAALVTMTLTLTREGETVTLMHQVHVENSP